MSLISSALDTDAAQLPHHLFLFSNKVVFFDNWGILILQDFDKLRRWPFGVFQIKEDINWLLPSAYINWLTPYDSRQRSQSLLAVQ